MFFLHLPAIPKPQWYTGNSPDPQGKHILTRPAIKIQQLHHHESKKWCFFFNVTATIIPTLIRWSWPGEALPKSFTNRLAKPDVQLRLGKEFRIGQGASDSSRTFRKEHRGIFNVHKTNTSRQDTKLNVHPRESTHIESSRLWWQFIARHRFKPRRDSLEVSVRTSRPSFPPSINYV